MASTPFAMSTKFVSEPKATYSLDIENLENLVEYSPNAATPDSLISKKSLPAGSRFVKINVATVAKKHWTTVQVAEDKHISLNSALVLMNHSCDPSLEVDTSSMEVRVVRDRNLEVGDELTFFYPSTEWQMDTPFSCLCGAGNSCLGLVSGAADIEEEKLKDWYINQHVLDLKAGQSNGLESE